MWSFLHRPWVARAERIYANCSGRVTSNAAEEAARRVRSASLDPTLRFCEPARSDWLSPAPFSAFEKNVLREGAALVSKGAGFHWLVFL